MSARPVIVLAFANDYAISGRHLDQLARERTRLRTIFEKAEEQGLCEVVFLPDATVETLFDTFQRKTLRGRIAGFYYGGHADGFRLLMQNAAGLPQPAHSDGLAAFLGGQTGLQFAFLNGCFSIPLAESISAQGVPAVIGTVGNIDDAVAADLSIAFFENLVKGLPLDRCYQDAVSLMLSSRKSGQAGSFYRGIAIPELDSRFPWEIRYKEGAEATVRQWNLPAAAGDLLFGLPQVVFKGDLPNTPYQFLKRYARADAPIFFGRNRDIRELYLALTGAANPKVLLFYGGSGVGKSSLLHAGLYPRLEGEFQVIYLRRDSNLGLIRTLGMALSSTSDSGSTADIMEGQASPPFVQLAGSPGERLKKWWQERETAAGKPLILILDQAEEAFTRPNAAMPTELDDFFSCIATIFRDPEDRPKGKLTLCYRKEYDGEIHKMAIAAQLPLNKIFLDKPGKDAVMEIVNGLTTTEALRQKYRLTIEEGLPQMIANDLCSDIDSPIAPILQIVLSRMWREVELQPNRQFTIAHYLQLKERGVYLEDFFRDQMNWLREYEQVVHADIERSGLALDLLNFHTTSLSTSGSRDLETLRQTYQHQADLLDELLRRFQEAWLLTSPGERQTALAHDTLAPVVQKAMRESDRPGQRALRILETKTREFTSNPETCLEPEDLALVEKGAHGMRMWVAREKELIEKSQARRTLLELERKRIRRLLLAGRLLIGVLAIIATVLWLGSERKNRFLAADRDFQKGRLLLETDPTQGLKFLWKSYERAQHPDQVLAAICDVYRENMFYEESFHVPAGDGLSAFDPKGQTIAVTSRDGIYVYDLQTKRQTSKLTGFTNDITSLIVTETQDIFAGSVDRKAYYWKRSSREEPLVFTHEEGFGDSSVVTSVALSADERKLATGHQRSFVHIWDKTSARRIRTIALPEAVGAITAITWPDSGNYCYIGCQNGQIWSFDFITGRLSGFYRAASGISAMATATGMPVVAVGLQNGWIIRWNNDKGYPPVPDSVKWHDSAINQLRFSRDNQYLISASQDHQACIGAIHDANPLFRLRGHRAPVCDLSIDEATSAVQTVDRQGAIKRWPFPAPLPVKRFATAGHRINAVAISRDNQSCMAASNDGRIYLWKAFHHSHDPQIILHAGSEVVAIAFSPENNLGAAGEKNGRVFVWRLNDGVLLAEQMLHRDAVAGLYFVDRNSLLSAGRDSSLFLWDWSNGREGAHLLGKHQAAITSLTPADAKQTAITVGLDSQLIYWNLRKKNIYTRIALPDIPLRLDKNPASGELILSFLTHRPIILKEDGGKTRILSDNPIGLTSWLKPGTWLTFNHQHSRLEEYQNPGFLYYQLRFPALPAQDQIQCFSTTSDGQYVLAGTRKGAVLLWRLRSSPVALVL